MMLHTQPVLLPQSHTLNCSNCNQILLEINLIDYFLKPIANNNNNNSNSQNDNHNNKNINSKNNTNNSNGYYYYVLTDRLVLQQLKINKKPFLCYYPAIQKNNNNNSNNNNDNKQIKQQNILPPFNLAYLKQTTCSNCNKLLGYKIQTVTKQMISCFQILGRIIINVGNVRVWAYHQDITQDMIKQFQENSKSQGEKQEEFLQGQLYVENGDDGDYRRQNKGKVIGQNNWKQQKKLQKKQQQIDINKINMRRLRTSLHKKQQQTQNNHNKSNNNNKNNKQMIEQIISTVDFFNQVLQNLQKRVTHTQNVCMLLKNKVQKIVPILRKS